MKPSILIRSFLVALLVLSFLGVQTKSAKAMGLTFTVTLVNDGSDATPGDGLCATLDGFCTLRAAIQEANAHAGTDVIHFHLPGSGTHVMSLFSVLPYITDTVTLDGTSQPNCSVPCIVLSGASISGTDNTGLIVIANSSIIKGFIITSWSGTGIAVNGQSNLIQSNDIGFWPGDPAHLGNHSGVWVNGANNVVGGTLPSQRNIISGNTDDGVTVGGAIGVSNNANVIEGNYIGTTTGGTAALPNFYGIFVDTPSSNTIIGGTSAGARNVISGNTSDGIMIYAYSGSTNSGASIYGNFIGLNAAGTGPLGNHGNGVDIANATLAKVGGNLAGSGNVIAFNSGRGINVQGTLAQRNSFHRNSIYKNGSLGIDLGGNGVTINDSLDPDAGPNGLQNFPVVTAAHGATRVITGILNSKISASYLIEFFSTSASTGCDPSHYGEGTTYLGQTSVTTNGSGNAGFNLPVSVSFAVGSIITATATDSLGNTSEFSACRTAN